MAFDQHMRSLEDNDPQQRTRLSQQAWLRVTESTDPVLRDLQQRHGKCFTYLLPLNVIAFLHFANKNYWQKFILGSLKFKKDKTVTSVSLLNG